MSDEPNHQDDESSDNEEITNTDEGGKTASNTTDDESKKDHQGDEESKGGEFSDVIVDSHMAQIQLGKTTLEEIGEKHEWIANAIRKRMADEDKPKKSELGLKDQVKAEILEEIQVADTKKQVEAIGTKDQVKLYDATFEKYQESLGAKEASELALQVSGVDLSKQAMRRQGMSLPVAGNAYVEDTVRVTSADKRMAAQMGVDPKVIAKNRADVESKQFTF